MLDQDVKITRQFQDGRFDMSGKVDYYIRVDFMVGSHGPFTVKVPLDGFTQAKRDDAVNVFAREVRVP